MTAGELIHSAAPRLSLRRRDEPNVNAMVNDNEAKGLQVFGQPTRSNHRQIGAPQVGGQRFDI